MLGRLGWKLVSFRLETAIGVLRRGMATDSRTRADLRGRALCSPSLPGAAADNEHEAKAPRACINQTAGVSACQRHSGRSGSISSSEQSLSPALQGSACLWAALGSLLLFQNRGKTTDRHWQTADVSVRASQSA